MKLNQKTEKGERNQKKTAADLVDLVIKVNGSVI